MSTCVPGGAKKNIPRAAEVLEREGGLMHSVLWRHGVLCARALWPQVKDLKLTRCNMHWTASSGASSTNAVLFVRFPEGSAPYARHNWKSARCVERLYWMWGGKTHDTRFYRGPGAARRKARAANPAVGPVARASTPRASPRPSLATTPTTTSPTKCLTPTQ